MVTNARESEQTWRYLWTHLVLQRDLVRNCLADVVAASGARSRRRNSGLGCTG
jgi:hypothetical protein